MSLIRVSTSRHVRNIDRTYLFVAPAAKLLNSAFVSALVVDLLGISRVRPSKEDHLPLTVFGMW
jgi:hypothetical protein